jgi:hypothetical protein
MTCLASCPNSHGFSPASNHDPRQAIAAFQALTINRMEGNVAPRTVHCDINVAATAGTRAGEIFSHAAPPSCFCRRPPGISLNYGRLNSTNTQSLQISLTLLSVLRFCTFVTALAVGVGHLSLSRLDCKPLRQSAKFARQSCCRYHIEASIRRLLAGYKVVS